MTLPSNGLNNVTPYRWTYADAAARTADTSVTADDLGKWARQLDDDTIWMLTATTPTWVQVGGAGGVAVTQVPYAGSSGTLKGNAHFTYNEVSGGSGGGQLVNEIMGAG